MKVSRTLLCVAAMTIGSNAMIVNAEAENLIDLDPFSVKNFYVGIEGGITLTRTNEDVIKLDDDQHARLNFGYELNNWLAVEASFIDFGSFEVEEILGVDAKNLASQNIQLDGQNVNYAFEIDAYGYGAGLKLEGTFVADVNVFARIGYFEATTEVNLKGVDDGDDSGFYYTAGVSYPFTDWLRGSVNWTRYSDIEILNTDASMALNTVNIGLQVNF